MALSEKLLIVANLAVCMTAIWACVCRGRFMSASSTKGEIRHLYTFWVILFAGSGISWLFGLPATAPQLLLAAGKMVDILVGIKIWQHGQPEHVVRA